MSPWGAWKAESSPAAHNLLTVTDHLQTLTEIGVEKNTTVVFPLPLDLMQGLSALAQSAAKGMPAKTEQG